MKTDSHRTQAPSRVVTTEAATFLELFLGSLLVLGFLRLAEKVQAGKTNAIDEGILRALRHPENPAVPKGPPWLAEMAQDVTAMGSGPNLSLITGVVIGFLALNRRFRAAGFLIVSLGSGMVLSRMLKDFFVRPRPTVVPKLTHFDPGSFPSGHSMLSALVYLTLGGILSRMAANPVAKRYFLSVAIALAMLVGASRVYLGVHFPSDVLAGWAAGSLWSGFCAQVARALQRRGTVEKPMASLPTLAGAEPLVGKGLH
ncbi:MAG: phosphatase PAP2 family protein [Verrucomicrobia bacterium]|nr:phosphatase PAP2 family protein [Verrucomicrobiota bacterium]